MTAYADWEQANSRFLAGQLASLRARLEGLAQAQGEATSAGSAQTNAMPPPPTSWMDRVFKRGMPAARSAAPAAAASMPLPTPPTAAEQDSEAATPLPALSLLAQRLELSDFERDVLLLCAAMELDTRVAQLCAQAQHDAGKPYPTFALAMALFDRPAWDAMSPERPLRYWRLVDLAAGAAQPLVGSLLRADERIVSYLKGANYLDERIAPLVTALAEPAFELPPSQQTLADAVVTHLRSVDAGEVPIVQLLGSDAASKQLVAADIAGRLGLRVHRIDAEVLPAALSEQETFVRLWQRECALLPLALYVDALETERVGAAAATLQRTLSRIGGLVFLDVREPWPLDRAVLPVDVAKPTPAEQRALWNEMLSTEQAAAADRPAVHFDLGANAIRSAAGAALALAQGDASRLPALLWTRCIADARPVLDQLAQPVEAKAHWDDLELPPAEKALLRQIADQVEHRGIVYDDWGFRARMNRGLGISVLFAGESGTGKTMAAEVIANELGLLLYRIDLSAVVNKYIGETEKNLRRLFDAAEGGGAILLFDEADALFGKRGEVKDSHDRYSNIEVNYLLQRMEAFRGLAILATNMKSALDQAFLRRLRFIVRFPFPGPVEREAIWRRALPAAVQVGAIDYARLARFNLTGASIHSIALNAAFLAARAGQPVGMPMLLEAARLEFRKLEKPVNESDFRWLERAEGGA
jgi:hypothetical protein